MSACAAIIGDQSQRDSHGLSASVGRGAAQAGRMKYERGLSLTSSFCPSGQEHLLGSTSIISLKGSLLLKKVQLNYLDKDLIMSKPVDFAISSVQELETEVDALLTAVAGEDTVHLRKGDCFRANRLFRLDVAGSKKNG